MADSGFVEIFDISGLNKAGFGLIGVYVNLGYEPYPENYNPLPASEFDSYTPDSGFIKNTGLRTPLFTGEFFSSPLLQNGDFEYITDDQGYTWVYNTFNSMAVQPFLKEQYPKGITRYSAALYDTPPPGTLQLVVNDKNQPQTFRAKDDSGNSISYGFAQDSHGNVFILGSVDSQYASDPLAAFEQATLPEGWSKEVRTLEGDLTIEPGYGDGNRRIYNQFRDNLTNNYFQIAFAEDGIGVMRGVPGLALAGGNQGDRIKGTRLKEIIYGARGDDRLSGYGGNDQIWGDEGDDVINPGKGINEIWGGAGADVFKIGTGENTIHDFSLSDGDRLKLMGIGYSVEIGSQGVEIITASGRTLLEGVNAFELGQIVLQGNLFML